MSAPFNNPCPECGQPRPTGAADGLCPHCLLRLGELDAGEAEPHHEFDQVLSEAMAGLHIGRYRLLEPIGEGGYGTVWMAEQSEPVRRKVALKVIKLGMDTKQVVARFEAERQALALMDHENIARVFDGGATETGRPYFVMELVRGLPLTAYCDSARLSLRERVELLIPVCQAVQHAHQKGVIHRDLKPSNVLVTEQDGKPVPKVIDFGIAKATDVPLTDKTLFTRFNQMIGTPAYMSPEQAGLGSLDIDTRTDIYSLGVLLYELLTGRTPLNPKSLRGANPEALLKSVREVEAPRPSTCLSTLSAEEVVQIASQRREEPERLVRLVHGDLDWIALKALEKDRTRRYASAQDLGADLQRFLHNEPIVARPPSNLYRFQKLARRNKLAFSAAGAVLAALVIGLIMASWQWVRATRNLRQARLSVYVGEVGLAQQALAARNLGRALELLDHQRPQPGDKEDFRGFEWRYLWQLSRSLDSGAVPGNPGAVSFSPDGRLLAASERDQTTILEMPSRRVITNLPMVAVSLAFSPRDPLLAVGGVSNVVVWDTDTWRPVRELPDVGYPVGFSPDGAWLLTGDPIGCKEHLLWRTDIWEPVASCEATPEFPWQLRSVMAFSPDGSLLATPWTNTEEGTCSLKLWKLPTLEPVRTLPPEVFAWSSAFLPGGRYLLIGSFFGELIVWDLQENRATAPQRVVTGILTSIAVAPDGSYFITAGNQGSLFVWDSDTWKILREFHGHKGGIWTSAISPNGRDIVTGAFDLTARFWDADLGESSQSSRLLKDGNLIAGFTPDSRTLVLAPSPYDHRWHLVDLERNITRSIEVPARPPLSLLRVVERPFDAVGPLPLGVLGRRDGTVELWDLAAGKMMHSWSAHTNEVSVTTLSPDGSRVATGDRKGQVKLWDTHTRKELVPLDRPVRPETPVAMLVFSPDGQTLAGGWWPNDFGDLVLWDVKTGNHKRSLEGSNDDIEAIAFSPDGRLVVGGSGGSARGYVWEVASGQLRHTILGHATSVIGLAFSPDGKTLATGSYDTIKLRNVATLQEVVSFPTERAVLRGLHFSPDGKTLAAGYLPFAGPPDSTNRVNNFVRLYHAPSLEEIAAIEAREANSTAK